MNDIASLRRLNTTANFWRSREGVTLSIGLIALIRRGMIEFPREIDGLITDVTRCVSVPRVCSDSFCAPTQPAPAHPPPTIITPQPAPRPALPQQPSKALPVLYRKGVEDDPVRPVTPTAPLKVEPGPPATPLDQPKVLPGVPLEPAPAGPCLARVHLATHVWPMGSDHSYALAATQAEALEQWPGGGPLYKQKGFRLRDWLPVMAGATSGETGSRMYMEGIDPAWGDLTSGPYGTRDRCASPYRPYVGIENVKSFNAYLDTTQARDLRAKIIELRKVDSGLKNAYTETGHLKAASGMGVIHPFNAIVIEHAIWHGSTMPSQTVSYGDRQLFLGGRPNYPLKADQLWTVMMHCPGAMLRASYQTDGPWGDAQRVPPARDQAALTRWYMDHQTGRGKGGPEKAAAKAKAALARWDSVQRAYDALKAGPSQDVLRVAAVPGGRSPETGMPQQGIAV